MIKRWHSMIRRPSFCFACNLFFAFGVVSAEIKTDFLMDLDPEFRVPDRIKRFNPDFNRLWIAALERPEIDMQRMAAETIARAHKYGIPDLIEAVPVLEKILLAESSHPSARFAAARALIVLESRNSSDKLLHASQNFGTDLRQLVEPAMAQWDVVPAKSIWIKRLESSSARPRDLILAIRGLGQVHEDAALSMLLRITTDVLRTADIRLEAATAAGQLAETSLETQADHLVTESRSLPLINRLCAIRLLSRHESDAAKRLLIEIANDAEPAIAAAALKRLNEIDPVLVLPVADWAIKHPDQHVREQGVSAYLSLPTVERVNQLKQVLNDAHPLVRQRVSKGFLSLARTSDLNDTIRAAAMEIINGNQWQGQEQAALLVGALTHQLAATRLVELLDSSRVEVMVASAWALRRIAVRETIPAVIDKIRRQTLEKRNTAEFGNDEQVAHLFELCGRLKVTDAAALMSQYVPYGSGLGERSRSAAIWALGLVNEGVPDEVLGEKFMDRINDNTSKPPESTLVKQMCVVSLARMKTVTQTPSIRKLLPNGTPPSRLGLALRWAIKELTGEELPEPIPRIVDQGSWFLEPLP